MLTYIPRIPGGGDQTNKLIARLLLSRLLACTHNGGESFHYACAPKTWQTKSAGAQLKGVSEGGRRKGDRKFPRRGFGIIKMFMRLIANEFGARLAERVAAAQQ